MNLISSKTFTILTLLLLHIFISDAFSSTIAGHIVDAKGFGIYLATVCSTAPEDACVFSDSSGSFMFKSAPILPQDSVIVVVPKDSTVPTIFFMQQEKLIEIPVKLRLFDPLGRKIWSQLGIQNGLEVTNPKPTVTPSAGFHILTIPDQTGSRAMVLPQISFQRNNTGSKLSLAGLVAPKYLGTTLNVVKTGYQKATYQSVTESDTGIFITLKTLPNISGYMDKISYIPGDSATIYLHSSGIYGERPIVLYSASGDSVDRVDCKVNIQNPTGIDPWANGLGFSPTFKYKLPKLKSGIYYWEKSVPFVVRDSSGNSEIIVIYPSNTLNAYTAAGGKSLYKAIPPDTTGKATTVSFHRTLADDGLHRPFFEWISKQKLPGIGYISDLDMDDFSKVRNAKLVIIAGHSEYWSRKARENFDRFINEGKDALILSGNTMWWQVRYNDSGDQLICYKDSISDPIVEPTMKTVVWASSYLKLPLLSSIGADFNHGGYGLSADSGWDGFKITSSSSPLLEGTGLSNGDTLSLPTGEYDGTLISGYDMQGVPIINTAALGFYQTEQIGYDFGFRNKKTVASFLVFRKTATSGIIINTSSSNWCSPTGIGGKNGKTVQKITLNAITKLIRKDPIFSP